MSEKKNKAAKKAVPNEEQNVTSDLREAFDNAPQVLKDYVAKKEGEVKALVQENMKLEGTIEVLLRKMK